MNNKTSFLKHLARYRQNIYEAHCQYTLQTMLNPWTKEYSQKYRYLFESKAKDYIAIIIDDRPSEVLRNSVLNTLIMCKLRIPIVLYTTRKKYKEMVDLFNDLNGYVKIELINKGYNEISQETYNAIVKDKNFWKRVELEKILLFQSDSLLIEPLDFDFFEYDYIGAPWVKTKFKTEYPIFSKKLDKEPNHEAISLDINTYPLCHRNLKNQLEIGNGGLSIRNREKMILICNRFESYPGEQEDVFFSRGCKEIGAKVADIETSKRFACEGMYSISIGMHKSYHYLSAENQAEIYERHIKTLSSILWSLENSNGNQIKNS